MQIKINTCKYCGSNFGSQESEQHELCPSCENKYFVLDDMEGGTDYTIILAYDFVNTFLRNKIIYSGSYVEVNDWILTHKIADDETQN
jgi:RecJ-like exonuclease